MTYVFIGDMLMYVSLNACLYLVKVIGRDIRDFGF